MADSTKGIAGHEGAGVVVAVGDGMDHKWKVGDRAGIKVSLFYNYRTLDQKLT
jgi:propanol-preferring alcohol dehydrogenase